MKQGKSLALILCLLFVLAPLSYAGTIGDDVKALSSPAYSGGVQYAKIDEYVVYCDFSEPYETALICEKQGETPITVSMDMGGEFVIAGDQVLFSDFNSDDGNWSLYKVGEAAAVTILDDDDLYAIGADAEHLWFMDDSNDDAVKLITTNYDGSDLQEIGTMNDSPTGLLPDGRPYCVEDDQIWALTNGKAESIFTAGGDDEEIDQAYVLGDELWVEGDERVYVVENGKQGFEIKGDAELFASTGDQAVLIVENNDRLELYLINAKAGAYCVLGTMKDDDAEDIDLRQDLVVIYGERDDEQNGTESKQEFKFPDAKDWKAYR